MAWHRRTVMKAAGAVAALGVVDACGTTSGSPGSSGSGPGGGGLQKITAVDLNTDGVSPGGANTAEVVDATNAFLDTLSSSQTAKIVYDFADHQARQTWSNYPAMVVPRSGVSMASLSATQRTAVARILGVALSPSGADQDDAIRSADDYLHRLGGNGSDGFGGLVDYFVAVYGTPSTTDPFMVQFGGHHLARNLTYHGDKVSQTPQFVGSEPISFRSGGSTVQPIGPESSTMFAMIGSLTTGQRTAARITGGSIQDLQMGPGKDTGSFPAAAGLKVTDLDGDQRQLVTAAIRAYSGDLAGTAADRLLARYEAELDQTRIGWANSTSRDGEHSYLRVDGPSVWIEFIDTRSPSTPNIHYHSVYRDKVNDYGSSKPG